MHDHHPVEAPEGAALVPVDDAFVGVASPGARNPCLVYLASLAAGSVPAQRSGLRTAARILSGQSISPEQVPWEQLRYQHLQVLRQQLATKYKPATVNRILCAVRGVLKEAWRLELLEGDAYQRARDVAGISDDSLPTGRALPQGELAALFDACTNARNRVKGARDAAVLALLYQVGLRREEVVTLNREQLLLDSEDVGELKIRGKGNKERLGYPQGQGVVALRLWFQHRGDAPGPMVCPVNKAGRITVRRLSGQAVAHLVAERVREARVPTTTPHDFRRTFITHLLDCDVDLATVAGLAGHAQLQTTARYDRRGDRAKRRAIGQLHVPLRPRAE